MTHDEMITVLQAYKEGQRIEFKKRGRKDHNWCLCSIPTFDFARYDYRVAVVPDKVPWEHIHDDFDWYARDEDGGIMFYVDEPVPYKRYWCTMPDYGQASDGYLVKVKIGNVPWDQSLQKRPTS